ncbi:hypothetical protein GF345_05015 [Candidatus Woesearchaeota archaeon]|nr:hypothetical protein [Candidatus Woesearchaeota archaeon]
MKFNYMKIRNNVFTWRQIERKDGMTFMRAKSRPFISIREAGLSGHA